MERLTLSNAAGETVSCPQSGAATLRNSLIVSQKAEHRITVWPRNLPLATYPREIKTHLHKKHGYKCSSSVIHNSQKVETQISISWCMDQETVLPRSPAALKRVRRGEGVTEDPLGLVTSFAPVSRSSQGERQKAVHWDRGYCLPKHSEVPESARLRVLREEKGGVRSCLGEKAGWRWDH